MGEKGYLTLELQIRNNGVAPFYYDWPFEIALLKERGSAEITLNLGWNIKTIMPGEEPQDFTAKFPVSSLAPGKYRLAVGVLNALPNGNLVRMANSSQGKEWLILGVFENK